MGSSDPKKCCLAGWLPVAAAFHCAQPWLAVRYVERPSHLPCVNQNKANKTLAVLLPLLLPQCIPCFSSPPSPLSLPHITCLARTATPTATTRLFNTGLRLGSERMWTSQWQRHWGPSGPAWHPLLHCPSQPPLELQACCATPLLAAQHGVWTLLF